MTNTYLIDKMAKEHNWGISSDKKIPTYVTTFLSTLNQADLTPIKKENMDSLPTKHMIDNNYCIQDVMQCYHIHANENLIVAFDVEPKSDPSFLKWWAMQPAHYREYSMHYGIHSFYQLKRTRLSRNAIEMLTNNTEIKKQWHLNNKLYSYELMMNNHWLSVTRRQFGKMTPLTEDAPDFVYNLIEYYANDYVTKNHQKTLITANLSKEASDLAKTMQSGLFTSSTFNEKVRNLSVSDYNDDTSLYEYEVALRLVSYLEWRLNHPKLTDSLFLKTWPGGIPISDRIWCVSLELESIVPKRAKDNEYRDGLPWLVYVAKTAYNYILNNQD